MSPAEGCNACRALTWDAARNFPVDIWEPSKWTAWQMVASKETISEAMHRSCAIYYSITPEYHKYIIKLSECTNYSQTKSRGTYPRALVDLEVLWPTLSSTFKIIQVYWRIYRYIMISWKHHFHHFRLVWMYIHGHREVWFWHWDWVASSHKSPPSNLSIQWPAARPSHLWKTSKIRRMRPSSVIASMA